VKAITKISAKLPALRRSQQALRQSALTLFCSIFPTGGACDARTRSVDDATRFERLDIPAEPNDIRLASMNFQQRQL